MLNISKPWTPSLIATVNNHEVKVAKISGAFIWHSHPNSDELFYVLNGEMTLEMENFQPAKLQKGDVFVVPKGIRHRPVSNAGAEILMVELEGTINTGDAERSGLTVLPEDVRGRGLAARFHQGERNPGNPIPRSEEALSK